MDEIYPQTLKNIKSSPKRLFAWGNLNLMNKPSIAVIGSRNSSEYGRKIAEKITKDLVKNNVVIVSGMASGIDSVAHETCIKNGGKTIAVLGSGFKNIYPKENEQLFYKILESDGLLLSEFPIDAPVQMKNFPKRNRIISGLSKGVLVVEATYRSGTSITARYARAQGKKVFCIPNSIGNKNSCGTIELVKQGAIIVTKASEILKNVGLQIIENSNNNINNMNKQLKILDNNSKKIFNCLMQNDILNAEQISIKTNLDIVTVNQLLTFMELDTIIKDTGFGRYKISEEYYEQN